MKLETLLNHFQSAETLLGELATLDAVMQRDFQQLIYCLSSLKVQEYRRSFIPL